MKQQRKRGRELGVQSMHHSSIKCEETKANKKRAKRKAFRPEVCQQRGTLWGD